MKKKRPNQQASLQLCRFSGEGIVLNAKPYRRSTVRKKMEAGTLCRANKPIPSAKLQERESRERAKLTLEIIRTVLPLGVCTFIFFVLIKNIRHKKETERGELRWCRQ